MSVTRREFLAATGGLAAAATMPNLWAAEAPQRRFNILFLMSDQHYAHVLGCAGNPVAKTPNLDALAAGGVRFAQATCVTPFCSPSRGTMVTGLYPHTHGIMGNVGEDKVGFVDPCVCTENILFDRGWATAHFGKWHLGKERDLRCYAGQPTVFELKSEYNTKRLKPLGDAAFDPGPRPGEVAAGGVFLTEKMAAFRQSADKTKGRRELPSNMGRARVKAEHDFNFWLADRCIAEIEKNRDRNFMITCSWSPPHAPWICPAAFYDLYKPEDMPLPASLDDSPPAYANDTSARWGRDMGVDNLREYLRCYYGQVSMIDACVGRILEALKRLGLEQDTLVLYTSDHGDLQAAHGMVGKIAPGFFEEVLRVPLILRYPAGIKPGAVLECPTDGANVAPTLLDFAGAPVPGGVQGHSLRRAIETGTCATPDAAFCERGGAGRGAWGRMVRTKKAKYSIFSDGRRELFDLENDPNEMRDLGAEPRAQALRDEMHALLMARLEKTQDAVADLIKGGVVTQPASRPGAKAASRPAAKWRSSANAAPGTEDMATRGRDPSAASGAEAGGGRPLQPASSLRAYSTSPALAEKR